MCDCEGERERRRRVPPCFKWKGRLTGDSESAVATQTGNGNSQRIIELANLFFDIPFFTH